VAQIFLSGLFAPADNGVWLMHAVIVEILIHIAFYLCHYSVPTSRLERSITARLTDPMICFWFSLVCVILMTVGLATGLIPEYFGLAA